MRVFLSCLVCRIVTFVLHKLGRGATSMPGKVALKVKRNVLKDLSKNTKVIVVTGTNGKTTSCRILEEGLKKAGKSYFINKSGANLITGVTASFIMNSTVTGKCKKDYAIIECDENAFKEVSRYIHCDVILVTNVFRDQLDRYGEVTHTLNAIKESVKNLPNAIVCLDADCSLTYSMSKEIPNKIITFGVNVPFDKNAKAPEISDAKYCIFCKHEYDYTYHTYGHLGGFVCNNCGYKRPQPDFAVESVEEMKNDHSVVVANLNGDRNIIKVNIGGAYNIYNAIGCAAALTALGIEQKNIIDAIENFNGAFGRMEHFKAGNNTVNLILVKNPAGFSQTMNFLKSIDDDFTLILSLNINGRVCFLYSCFWGLLGILWIKAIYPIMSKVIEKLPVKLGTIIMWAFIVFFVFDSFVSATAGLRMDKRDAGQAPNNVYEQFLDNHFPDERMNEIYANSQKVTK